MFPSAQLDSVTLISSYKDSREVRRDHTSLLDSDSYSLIMPSARVRLIPVRPSTIISNHVNNSGSNLIIIRGVKFYFTSCVVDLEHDTARIAISAVSPVGDDASIFARVIGHPGVPILVSVMDKGHFDITVDRN